MRLGKLITHWSAIHGPANIPPPLKLQVAGLSVLTNIANLRFHRCSGLTKTWPGLLTLLNALPKLQVLCGISPCRM